MKLDSYEDWLDKKVIEEMSKFPDFSMEEIIAFETGFRIGWNKCIYTLALNGEVKLEV